MDIVDKLIINKDATDEELIELLNGIVFEDKLYKAAEQVRKDNYGDEVYLRGLIEISSFCKNNCYYCGLRAGNEKAVRYRLTKEQILECCKKGAQLGYKTFVLQGGEDPYFTDDLMCDIVSAIHSEFPDNVITLSLGERSRKSYQNLYEAGARRYLLRHEAINQDLYKQLHPNNMSLDNRIRCLYDLKEIGYQVGTGFMIQAPFQSTENIIEDIRFMQKFKPDMIGVGPFIKAENTPMSTWSNGGLGDVPYKVIAILRLMFPYALIPATTAFGTLNPQGREKALCVGANVVMPNLSPTEYRKAYSIYDNKICTGEEAAECKACLEQRITSIGYRIVDSVGNVKK